jgi:hypothetical protein
MKLLVANCRLICGGRITLKLCTKVKMPLSDMMVRSGILEVLAVIISVIKTIFIDLLMKT